MNGENESDLWSKLIDKIFALKKDKIYLLLILIFGFILRLIAALNIQPNADELHYVTHSIDFYKQGKLVTWEQSSGLWFAITSIIYNLFGYTQISSRIASVLFGSFSIILVYLISREFFDKKISFLSAFLLAIAPFHIRSTIAEMDVTAMFFALFSIYFFVRATKEEKDFFFAASGVFLGLAIYTKVYPVLFVPSFLVYFLYLKHKKKETILNKKNIKFIIIFFLAISVFCLPELSYNYSLYKNQGFMDLQFSKFFNIGGEKASQYYSWIHGWDEGGSWGAFLFPITNTKDLSGHPLSYVVLSQLGKITPLIFLFSMSSLLLVILRKKPESKEYSIFFILLILFIFPFLASTNLLIKHYLFFELLMIPLASSFAIYLTTKINKKRLVTLLALLFLTITLFLLSKPITVFVHVFGEGSVSQIISFKEESIGKNSLMVLDGRIYRGESYWVSYGRPSLEGPVFVSLINQQGNISSGFTPTEVYYIECVYDDCGWGTIRDQPDFNASMEQLTQFFKENGEEVETIYEADRHRPYLPWVYGKKVEAIKIHRANLMLHPQIIQIANQPKNWFLYDIGYEPKEKQFDFYIPKGFVQIILDKTAHLVVAISLILAFISSFYVLYLLIIDDFEENESAPT